MVELDLQIPISTPHIHSKVLGEVPVGANGELAPKTGARGVKVDTLCVPAGLVVPLHVAIHSPYVGPRLNDQKRSLHCLDGNLDRQDHR